MSAIADTLRHAAIYSAANMLGKLAAFIMLPFYAHALGTQGYGIIGMVDASLALLTSVLGYGCQNAIVRLYHEQPESHKSHAISTGYWVSFGVTLILVSVAILLREPLSALLLGDAGYSGLLAMALLAFFLDMNMQAAASVLLIHRKSAEFSMLSLVRLLCALSMNVLFIVVLDGGVYGYFLSSVLTSLVHFVWMQHLCFTRAGTAFHQGIAYQVVQFQWPLIPGALVSFAARQAERVSLRFFESIEKVGVLEMAYKFPSLITMLIHEPFMNAWNTERIRLAQTGTDAARQQIGHMFTLALFSTALGGLMIALCIHDVLILLTPPSFWEAARIAQIECLTLVLACATQHVSLGFLYQKDTRAWARLTSLVSLAKIGLSVALVAAWGIWGAAYSALAAAGVLLVLAWRGGQRRFAVDYRHGWNITVILFAITLFAVGEYFRENLLLLATRVAHGIAVGLAGLPGVGEGVMRWQDKLPYAVDLLLRLLLGACLLLMFPLLRSDRWRSFMKSGSLNRRAQCLIHHYERTPVLRVMDTRRTTVSIRICRHCAHCHSGDWQRAHALWRDALDAAFPVEVSSCITQEVHRPLVTLPLPRLTWPRLHPVGG